MREIKFRAWDKKRKKMWYPEDMQHGDMVDHKNCGDLMSHDIEQLTIGANGKIYILDECGNYEYPENIGEDYEIMWFTGLKDINNKEMYELDVIVHSNCPIKYLVRFGKYNNGNYDYPDMGIGWFQTQIDNLDCWDEINKESIEKLEELFPDNIAWGESFPTERIEILGNAFENPELLKEVENA